MKTETLEARINWWKWGIACTAGVLVLAYAIYFGWHLGQKPAMDAEKWGQFGDFVGGLLNPLVAFAAFYWLTQSVKIQAEEFKKIAEDFSHTSEIYEEQRKAAQQKDFLTGLQALIAEKVRNLNEGRKRFAEIERRLTNGESECVQKDEDLLDRIDAQNKIDQDFITSLSREYLDMLNTHVNMARSKNSPPH